MDVASPVTLVGEDEPCAEEEMDVVVESGEVEQLAPLMELAATSTVHQIEIRHSLLALQDILTARIVEKSIDRSTFMHINGQIATAKYNKEFNSAGLSIWDVNPRDDSSYEAILSALRLEPLPMQYNVKVILCHPIRSTPPPSH